MKFGILAANTMQFAGPKGAAELAQAAEMAGFESVWTAEHVLWPAGYESEYPYDDSGEMPGDDATVLPDPLIWLTWMAAHSTTLKLATGILIVPERHPAVLAKEVASLDSLSEGRLLLGIGVGWLAEEFAALNVPWERRGQRTDEYIDVMRRLWASDRVDFHGEFVNFDQMSSNPKPHNGTVPIVVGGHSKAAARRAAKLGDGFVPLGGDIPELLDIMRQTAADLGRDPSIIEITASHDAFKTKDPMAGVQELESWGVHRAVFNVVKLRKGEITETCQAYAQTLGIR
jgi:probable F420-dependent oxidoreductase